MKETVEKALCQWDFPGANFQLAAKRENHVFRIDHDSCTYALRLHRAGLRRDSELRSELQWMRAVGEGGLAVPRPVPASDGRFVQVIDGVQVDVLTWLDGEPLGETGTPLKIEDREATIFAVGREMARLHDISDAWAIPDDFDRLSWDAEGLVGEAPVWDRFWGNPMLPAEDREKLIRLRDLAKQILSPGRGDLDFGLIHADLVRENIILNGDRVQFIDFDDGGFGYRLFDVATALLKNIDEPEFDLLKSALLNGYHSIRTLDTSALDLFMALRSATYVGWIISRMDEDGAARRNRRFIRTALAMTDKVLASDTLSKAQSL